MLFAESYSLQSVQCILASRTFSQLCSAHITNLLHPYNIVTVILKMFYQCTVFAMFLPS